MKYPARILLIDTEVSPLIGYAYGKWETNLIEVDHEQHLQCVAYKWLGEDKTYCFAQPDFPIWNKDRFDDSALSKKLWDVMNTADIVVAHNAKKFDIRQINTSFQRNDLDPPRPYKVLDTLQLARKHFKFSSNSLDDLAKTLKVGRKLEKGVPQLWKLCMNGDKKAWKFMKAYNVQDVVLLEKIFLKFLKWIDPFPRIQMDNGKCPKCGSSNMKRNGMKYYRNSQAQRYKCLSCGDANLYGPTVGRDTI